MANIRNLLIITGDIGEIPVHVALEIKNVDSKASLREHIAAAIASGIDPKLVYGVNTCIEHKGFIELHAEFNAKAYTWGLDKVWCRQCFTHMRAKKPVDCD